MYSETTYIFLTRSKLPTIQQFLEFTLSHMDATDPFQNALSAGFIRLLWRHICHWPMVWPHPPVACPISQLHTFAVYVHATCRYYMYFAKHFFLYSKVFWKALLGRPPYRLQWLGKTSVLSEVRPLWQASGLAPCERPPASACFPTFFHPFWSDTAQVRSPNFFFEIAWKIPCLIASLFKEIGAWVFSSFKKTEIGHCFSERSNVETPAWTDQSSHHFQVGVGSYPVNPNMQSFVN